MQVLSLLYEGKTATKYQTVTEGASSNDFYCSSDMLLFSYSTTEYNFQFAAYIKSFGTCLTSIISLFLM